MRKFLKNISLVAAVTVAVLSVSGGATAQNPENDWFPDSSEITPDPRVTFGALDNGMKYAVMHSQIPRGVVSVRFRIGAGSMHESQGQEGLAHVLEHLAFRSTVNYPAPEGVKDRLEELGLSLGRAVNASTGQDETIFTFDIAAANREKVAGVLDIVVDIARNLTLTEENLDAERGIVLAEERERAAPNDGAQADLLQAVFADHPLARPPIGEVAVIETAGIDRVQDFYDRYYRPERAAIVIVGPVDADEIIGGLEERFGDWSGRGEPGPGIPEFSPDEGGRVVINAEPEIQAGVSLVWARSLAGLSDSREQRRRDLEEGIALQILNARLAEAGRSPDAPGAQMGAGVRNSSDIASLTIMSVAGPLGPDTAVAALAHEQKLAIEMPITPEEVDTALAELREAFEGMAASRMIGTRILASTIISGADGRTVVTSPEQSLELFNELAPQITPTTVKAGMQRIFPGEPLIFVTGREPPEGGDRAMLAALESGRSRQASVSSQTADVVKPWPYTAFGPPGQVVERRDDPLGVTLVRFANNVRLTVRETSFREDQIQVRVLFGSGALDYPSDRQSAGRLWTRTLIQGGLVGLTNAERERTLAGHRVSVSAQESEGGFTLSGQTNAADIDLQLQLLAAYMTAPAWRIDNLDLVKSSYADQIEAAGSTPEGALGLWASRALYSGDPRWSSPDPAFVRQIEVDEIREFMEPIMATSEMEIVLVGNITPDDAIDAVSKTFGAFSPRAPLRGPESSNDVRFPEGGAAPVVITHRGRADQALAAIYWPTDDFDENPMAAQAANVLHAAFRRRLIEDLRTRQGRAYSVSGSSLTSRVLTDYGRFSFSVELAPEDLDAFFTSVEMIAADLRENGITDEEFYQTVSSMRRSLMLQRPTDIYWSTNLQGVHRNPARLEAVRDPVADLEQLQPVDVRNAIRFLTPETAVRVQVLAENAQTPEGGPSPATPTRFRTSDILAGLP